MNNLKKLLLLLIFSLTLFGQQKRLMHCFTYQVNNNNYKAKWIKAKDKQGKTIYLLGKIIDGFFHSKKIINEDKEEFENSYKQAQEFCLNSIQERKLLRIAIKEASIGDQPMDIVFNDNKKINQLIVFGDSMSDDGNLLHRIKVLPSKPYFAGRFSNGPNWVDYLRANKNMPIQNWAVGGAMSNFKLRDEDEIYNGKTPFLNTARALITCNVQHEIKNYKKISLKHKSISKPESSLYIIWAGGNDYLSRLITPNGYKDIIQKTVQNLVDDIKLLEQIGARNIAILNLPNLGMLPFVLNLENNLSMKFTQLSKKHNKLLEEQINELQKERNNLDLLHIDIFSAVDEIMNDKSIPKQVSLIGEVCYSKAYCNKIKNISSIFWDSLHPNTEAHRLLSEIIFEKIKSHFTI